MLMANERFALAFPVTRHSYRILKLSFIIINVNWIILIAKIVTKTFGQVTKQPSKRVYFIHAGDDEFLDGIRLFYAADRRLC